jgi:hypothetical protein
MLSALTPQLRQRRGRHVCELNVGMGETILQSRDQGFLEAEMRKTLNLIIGERRER